MHTPLIKQLKTGRFQVDRRLLLAVLVLLPIHFALVKLSTLFAFPDGTAPIWPSSGIFLAMLLMGGRRFWVVVWLCDVLVLQALFYSNPLLSISIASIDTAEALMISGLIWRFLPRYPFNRAIDAIKFVALLIPYPILSAVIAVTVQCVGGFSAWEDFGMLWRSWFTSSIVSMLVVTPVLLSSFQGDSRRFVSPVSCRSSLQRLKLELLKIGEFLLAVGALSVIGYFSFWGDVSIEYMIILPLLWTAFRFGQREATLMILFAIGTAVVGTAQNHGPFIKESIAQSMVLLQSFMSALTIATLVLAAAVQENRISAAQLKQANDELEERVNARTVELTQTLQQLQTTQSQLVQQEKMSSLGQLVAGIAHEINNPINFIHGNLTHIQTYTQDLLSFIQFYQTHYPHPAPEIAAKAEEIDLAFLQQDLAKILSSMKMGSDRIRQIVLSLRNFSRMDEAEFKRVDIHEGIDSTLLILQHRLKGKPNQPEIAVIKNYDSVPKVECFAGQLNQVFMNILVNAIDALEEAAGMGRWSLATVDSQGVDNRSNVTVPTITIRTKLLNARWVQITIADNGTGMSDTTRQHLFNPFFTTKPIGKGTGMGMSISYQIITEKHGGKLDCFSTLGKGTEFIIQIPLRSN
jgi:signal transduction histidine kinase